MKYKVGDRVLIKSIDWYNMNKDKHGYVPCGEYDFVPQMSVFCGKVLTIDVDFEDETYLMKEDTDSFVFTTEMIECKVDMETKKSEDGLLADYEELTDRAFKGGYEKCKSDIELNGFQLPEGYIFKDEHGNVINATKIVLEKKKKDYPKTYCECKDILGLWDIDDTERGYYKTDLIDKLQMLLICRDAYWKIAGEEMGLGKPWEPDWNDDTTHKFIIHTIKDKIHCGVSLVKNHLLAFPTEEMRDAFKENFGPDIEICKEFL